jgi:hypothetical protein
VVRALWGYSSQGGPGDPAPVGGLSGYGGFSEGGGTFKGRFACGHEEVRAYWTEQWSEIDPHVEPDLLPPGGYPPHLGRCAASCARRAGIVVANGRVGHRFTVESGLIRSMEVCRSPQSDQSA